MSTQVGVELADAKSPSSSASSVVASKLVCQVQAVEDFDDVALKNEIWKYLALVAGNLH